MNKFRFGISAIIFMFSFFASVINTGSLNWFSYVIPFLCSLIGFLFWTPYRLDKYYGIKDTDHEKNSVIKNTRFDTFMRSINWNAIKRACMIITWILGPCMTILLIELYSLPQSLLAEYSTTWYIGLSLLLANSLMVGFCIWAEVKYPYLKND
jgi:hypothetical protein